MRFGSALRTARQRGAAGPGSTGQVALKPTVPLALLNIVDNCPERLFASTKKENPM